MRKGQVQSFKRLQNQAMRIVLHANRKINRNKKHARQNIKKYYNESIEVNDINYTQHSEIAELFNEHFTNVGHDLAHQIPPSQDQPDKFIPETSTVYTFN